MLSVFVVVDITPSCARQALAFFFLFSFFLFSFSFYLPRITYLYESSSDLKCNSRTFLPGTLDCTPSATEGYFRMMGWMKREKEREGGRDKERGRKKGGREGVRRRERGGREGGEREGETEGGRS